MALRIVAMRQTLQVAIAETSGPEMAAKLAAFAKASLADAIASGRGSRNYVRTVNGSTDAPEESVRPPGPIVYRFSWLDEAIVFALEFLRDRSPVGPAEMGHYRDMHQVLIGGTLIGDSSSPESLRDAVIPLGSEVVISNAMPYARKIEVGAMNMTVAPHVYEDARKAVNRRYSQLLRADVRFISRSDGYVLKTPSKRNRRRRDERSRGGGAESLTYPALILNLRT
jgi:hypothetical protein